jgi:hypothetical protein
MYISLLVIKAPLKVPGISFSVQPNRTEAMRVVSGSGPRFVSVNVS